MRLSLTCRPGLQLERSRKTGQPWLTTWGCKWQKQKRVLMASFNHDTRVDLQASWTQEPKTIALGPRFPQLSAPPSSGLPQATSWGTSSFRPRAAYEGPTDNADPACPCPTSAHPPDPSLPNASPWGWSRSKEYLNSSAAISLLAPVIKPAKCSLGLLPGRIPTVRPRGGRGPKKPCQ